MGKSEERRHIKQKVEKTKSITNNLTSKAASILESLSSKIKYQSTKDYDECFFQWLISSSRPLFIITNSEKEVPYIPWDLLAKPKLSLSNCFKSLREENHTSKRGPREDFFGKSVNKNLNKNGKSKFEIQTASIM